MGTGQGGCIERVGPNVVAENPSEMKGGIKALNVIIAAR